jgi:type I restriction-modification system DNA methylase subunit
MPNVSNLIKTIQDILRNDAGVDGDAQRLAQLGWMFFLKIFDDREKEMEVLRDNYKSPLPNELRWSNWATDEEGITGDALLAFANNDLLPRLKVLCGSGDVVTLIKAAFDGANNCMINGTLMRQVINKINGIDFNGGATRPTVSNPAWKTSRHGASPSTRSRPATSISTSRTRTAPTPAPATWTTCFPNTNSSSPRSPRRAGS